MTEKNIFVCKLLLLNISGFSSDHSVHPLLLKKINPLFPGNPSLKIERIDPVKPHSTGRRGGGGGAHCEFPSGKVMIRVTF